MKINKSHIITFCLVIALVGVITLTARYNDHYVSSFMDITIESNVLNESRKVFIRLPENFDSNKAYPLIIRTDGNFNLTKWDAVLNEHTKNGVILVSIPNQFWEFTRNRDLVPPYARQDVNTDARPEPNFEARGEADKFLQFIEIELLPYLSSNYKLTDDRILSGFSAGGSFVLYTLHTKPELFNGYFAFSPAAWYDDMTVVKHFTDFLQTSLHELHRPTYLYISVGGAEHPLMLNAFNKLEDTLTVNSNDRLEWHSTINAHVEHSENPALSVESALTRYNKFIEK